MSMLQPNFFQFPNVIVDELIRFLTPAETMCLLVIIRKTRGWNKQADAISLSQFQELTGIKSKRTIMRALHRLCVDEVGLIAKNCKPRTTTIYRLGAIFYVKKCTRADIAKIAIALDEQKTPAPISPIAFNNPTKDSILNTGKRDKENAQKREVKAKDESAHKRADKTADASDGDHQESVHRSIDGVDSKMEEIFKDLAEACRP